MPSNIEIKAFLPDPYRVRQIAEQIGEDEGAILQEDTFFTSSKGRLKLRRLSPTHGELIFYERPDAPGPKQSHYVISTTGDPDGLRQLLSEALGIEGVVRKKRHLFLFGKTRIHLDEVEGLGNYLELEVILQEGQRAEDGMAIATALMEKLGVKNEDLIAGAYIDLIKKRS
ncbi:MAG: class IV adenylate cyclase [Thermodesulfobacteriota bacterium]|nr:class IV adenylate cyclase [Thermodesulfobacteriota bacterium]